MVLVGSGLAVLQAVWVIGATGRHRARLLKSRAVSDAREARIDELENELRNRWGDDAADVSNLEEQVGYEPNAAREALRAERDELESYRVAAGWMKTYGDLENMRSTKEQELHEVETEWRTLWTQGVPGLLGGLLALAGGILVALATN